MKKKLIRVKPLLAKLGTKISSRRKKVRMLQAELADKAELHRTYVSDLERGERNASILTLHRVAMALETTVTALTKGIRA